MNKRPYRDILDSAAADSLSRNADLWPKIAARLERKSLMSILRTRPILAMLIAILILLTLSGVAYAVGNVLGYVQGFGIVDENAPLRALSQPVSQTRDGITWTVKEAILGPNKTVIVYSLGGTQQDMLPNDENISGCTDMPEIHLPNGDVLHVTGGEGGYRETRWEYDPIPVEVNDVIYFMPCVADTLPGKAPTNWELPLHFIPTSEEKNIMPILEVSPFPTTIETETTSAVSLYGISMKLDKFIPLPDGYYLIGHMEWADDRISEVFPSGWGMKAFDDSGRELPLEPVLSGEDRVVYEALEPNQWVYRLYGRNFNGVVTLHTGNMSVVFKEPIRLTLDSPSNEFNFSDSQLNQSWDLKAAPLGIPEISANAVRMEYVQIGDGRGFDLTIQADPTLDYIYFDFESGLDTSGLSMISGGGGGSSRNESTGTLHAIITTNAKINFPLGLIADGVVINGNWDTIWEPAEMDPDAVFVYVPDACVTLEKWQNILKNKTVFPTSLQGELSHQSNKTSPDHTKTAASTFDGQLIVTESATNQWTVVMTAEHHIRFIGWTPDSRSLIYVDADDFTGVKIKAIDIQNREARTLIDTRQNYDLVNAFVSLDGQWITYSGRVTGRMTPGIFISKTDGTEKRMLVQLDYWMSSVEGLSMNGKWLTFSATDTATSLTTRGALNIETCQVYLLP